MDILEQLERDEGLRLKPYKDSVGKVTIGIGRNLDDVGISAEEAGYLCSHDIARSTADVKRHLPWSETLSPERQAVLVNMAFNMGIGKLMGFKNMLAFLQKGDFQQAAEEMLNSVWAGQVGPRAHRLAQQMRTNEWQ